MNIVFMSEKSAGKVVSLNDVISGTNFVSDQHQIANR